MVSEDYDIPELKLNMPTEADFERVKKGLEISAKTIEARVKAVEDSGYVPAADLKKRVYIPPRDNF